MVKSTKQIVELKTTLFELKIFKRKIQYQTRRSIRKKKISKFKDKTLKVI